MIKKYWVLWVISCLFFVAHAMENNMLTDIKLKKDLVPFVGKVVAYRTLSYTLGMNDGYVLYGGDYITKYGYVLADYLGENDNFMIQLLKSKEEARQIRFLNSSEISWGLHMRNINQQEAQDILNALKIENAKFDYYYYKNKEDIIFSKILAYLEQA